MPWWPPIPGKKIEEVPEAPPTPKMPMPVEDKEQAISMAVPKECKCAFWTDYTGLLHSCDVCKAEEKYDKKLKEALKMKLGLRR